jgi:hypothetical protein
VARWGRRQTPSPKKKKKLKCTPCHNTCTDIRANFRVSQN